MDIARSRCEPKVETELIEHSLQIIDVELRGVVLAAPKAMRGWT